MSDKPRVGLFVTCLVDFHRPTVGFAAIRLLEAAGCEVHVPRSQVCCGQPAYNSGDRATSRDIAAGFLAAFSSFDYVVVPSGSCGAMLRHHVPQLLDGDPGLRAQAEALASRTYELTSFLVDVMHAKTAVVGLNGRRYAFHDACSGLRELGIQAQPRLLLRNAGGQVVELREPEVCCGFGGTFCVKYPEISAQMVSKKAEDVRSSMAPVLLAGDLGCLLNIAGRLRREHATVEVRHVAEVLAGMTDRVPPIGGMVSPASATPAGSAPAPE